jgi:hypothetical protein
MLVAGLGVGCSEDGLGTEVITTTWDVSDYTVVGNADCGAVTEDPLDPFNEFEITIDGSDAALESVEFTLGGVTMTYDPTADTVVFTDTFTDSPAAEPDCVVELMDEFTVELENTSVSLDQNTTVQVTWDHEETDVSAVPGTCTPDVWFNVVLPCTEQATFTLTQQQTQ